MAKKPKTNAREVSFALSFLKYAGVKFPERNAYLLLAVIAWLRQESGGIGRVIGNNPFNIRSSPYASGYRISRNGNGRFAIFKTLDAGARATVALLKSDGANGWRGYGRIMRSILHGGGSETADRDQAIQFLTAIALSRWDAAHYGSMVGQDVGTYDGTKNHLIQVWMKLLGAPVIIPPPPVKPPKPVDPPQPRILDWHTPQYERIEPYAAYRFIKDREEPPTPLTGGLV